MKIYIGADHKGFGLKEAIKDWFERGDYEFEDMGAYELNPDDDYTLFAEKVASIVANQEATRGILICGSGVGVNIVANKFDDIRASVGFSEKQVKAARNDDDMNILCLAADFTKKGKVKKIVKTFLETKFSGREKHKRRVNDIKKIEANN